jgi:hypothetical protein
MLNQNFIGINVRALPKYVDKIHKQKGALLFLTPPTVKKVIKQLAYNLNCKHALLKRVGIRT